MDSHSRRQGPRRILTAVLCVTAVLFGAIAPMVTSNLTTHAQSLRSAKAASPRPDHSHRHAHLQLQCSRLGGKAKAYAENHGYCRSNGKGPDNTVNGDCGSSSLYLYSDSATDPGTVAYHEEASSTLGTIVAITYMVVWAATNGQSGHFSGTQAPFKSDWDNWDTNNPGQFVTVAASMPVLTAVLWWGGVCYGLDPSDAVITN